MEVILRNITKRFGREVIFQNVDHTLAAGSRTAILGPNGSGKSTLVQLFAGAITPTTGTITHVATKVIPEDEVFSHVSIASPYLGLYEDLSLAQVIEFHGSFKPFRTGISYAEVARITYLEHALDKPILHFSSGMKQRLKLGLAILSDTTLLLLDEPSSNLDADAVGWYRELLAAHMQHRTLVVASNRQPREHDMCTAVIEMASIKG